MSEITDRIWALREAAKPEGFMPNAHSVSEFAKFLEGRGWLGRSGNDYVWVITSRGRAELARLEMENEELDRVAAALWRKENPDKSVFACDADEKERYRERIRATRA